MKRILIIVVMLVLAACAPRGDEELPTLARLATVTEGPSPTTDMTQVALARTPLPATFTATFTPTLTHTPDPSVTATLTPTVTVTPSSTITNTPSPTATDLPTLDPDSRPILAFALTAAAATILPQDYQVPPYQGIEVTLSPEPIIYGGTLPPGIPSAIPALGTAPAQAPIATTCTILPQAGFGTIYQNNPDVAAQLGCPIDGSAQGIPAAWQSFEQGMLVWLNGEILVLYNTSDSFQILPDTFVEGVDPETSSEVPPAGLYTPVRGFLKVWANNSVIHNGLGWATNTEMGVNATVTYFQNGRMIWLPGRSDVIVIMGSQQGTWLRFTGQFSP